MSNQTYQERRDQIQVYFDRTALDAWKKFASDAPLSRIRSIVREGREAMQAVLLSHFPKDLRGWRILDAGCGAGPLSFELARRGADVVGIDLSPEIIALAANRAQSFDGIGSLDFCAGDMLSSELGAFDGVVSMDCLIHYGQADIADALAELAARTSQKIVFTVAPSTPLLVAKRRLGTLFPKADQAPAIQPTKIGTLQRTFRSNGSLADWNLTTGQRVSKTFYISQAMEMSRA